LNYAVLAQQISDESSSCNFVERFEWSKICLPDSVKKSENCAFSRHWIRNVLLQI